MLNLRLAPPTSINPETIAPRGFVLGPFERTPSLEWFFWLPRRYVALVHRLPGDKQNHRADHRKQESRTVNLVLLSWVQKKRVVVFTFNGRPVTKIYNSAWTPWMPLESLG